jgi:hypothetical protein
MNGVGERVVGPRLYIAVTFWGEQYRRYFVDFCLASLLAPENIPAIADKASARLLIATTDADWEAMQAEPIVQAVRAYIAIEHLAHRVSGPGMSRHDIMQAMSVGHRRLAERMFEDHAYGIFVYPDSIFADGSISRLQELARRGLKVVMCLAVRFANEGLIGALRGGGFLRPGLPLTIDPASLARLSIAHMHSETVRWNFEADVLDYGAHAFWWTVTPGENLLFLSGNWAPVLLNYGALEKHDASPLERWTLDGDYVQKNFPDSREFYIVQNTDELFLSSFTPESQMGYALKPFPPYRLTWLRRWLKTRLAHHYLITRGLFDPLKLEFFYRPIRMQGGPCTEEAWQQRERQAAVVMEKMQGARRSVFELVADYCLDQTFKLYKWFNRFREQRWPRQQDSDRA